MPGRGTEPGEQLYPECGGKGGIYRHRKNGTRPCAACRRYNAKRHADYRKRVYLEGRRLVPALGCQRRIRALAVMGWSREEIGARCGMSAWGISKILRQGQLSVDLARKVDAVYRELAWDLAPGPKGHLTRVRARNRGWHGPLDWEDIDTDVVPWSVLQRDHSEALAMDRELRKVQAKRDKRAQQRAAGGTDVAA